MSSDTEKDQGAQRLAIALSGGGHRATIFGLGALLYIVDTGTNHRVVSIASVSGGSIANGMVAQAGPFTKLSRDDFLQQVMRPLARRIAGQGILFAPALTKGYLVVLGVLALAMLTLVESRCGAVV
jgi:hypothetical protein